MSAPMWKDPIAEAWKKLHKQELPKSLRQTNTERAGCANAIQHPVGKGKHVLAVCP